MAGFASIEMHEMHSPASDCSSSFHAGSTTSSLFLTAVDSSHNFTEYSVHDNSSTQTSNTQPRAWQEALSAVPMRRSPSRSSTGSVRSHTRLGKQLHSHSTGPAHSHKAGSGKSRARLQTTLAHAYNVSPSLYPMGYGDATLDSSYAAYGVPAMQPMGPAYLSPYANGLPMAYGFYDGSVNPLCTQVLDFDSSAPASVGSPAFGSAANSRHSSPDAETTSAALGMSMPTMPMTTMPMPMTTMPMSTMATMALPLTSMAPLGAMSPLGMGMVWSELPTTSSASSAASVSSLSFAPALVDDSQSDTSDAQLHGDEARDAEQEALDAEAAADKDARDHYLYKNATAGEDGLYHCPWEGDASCSHRPEKLKCSYDKFVDSHLKPYRCKNPSCTTARFSSTACLLRHEREAHAMHGHGDKPYLCPYAGCDRAQPGFGFPRQWNLKDHKRRVHRDEGQGPVGTQDVAQVAQVAQDVAQEAQETQAPAAGAPVAPAPATPTVAPASLSTETPKSRKRKSTGPPDAAPRKSTTVKASRSAAVQAAAELAMAEQAERDAQAAVARAAQMAAAQAAAEAARAAAEAEMARRAEQWRRARSTLVGLVNNGLNSPTEVGVEQQLGRIQRQIETLTRLTAPPAFYQQG